MAAFRRLNGASLTAPQGCFLALLGPSGSGKTTLPRILGGLELADSGSVRFADLNWLDMPARERKAGFVFQQYALFRHMTVAKNIAFGLEVRPRSERPSRADINNRVKRSPSCRKTALIAGLPRSQGRQRRRRSNRASGADELPPPRSSNS